MGKEIEKLTLGTEDEVVLKIDLNNQNELNAENLSKCDVAIEFTSPSTVISNIKKCFEASIPIVVGTTGWHDHLNEISETCKAKDQTLFYASNFSIGVNLFFEANRYLASLMNNYSEYDVRIMETHHTAKLDAPSGTAITTANLISANLNRKNGWTMNNPAETDQIPIEAIRKDDVKGIHEVTYESDVDSIIFKHSAKSRIGFAKGALMAAKYIHNRKGVFTMNDLLGL